MAPRRRRRSILWLLAAVALLAAGAWIAGLGDLLHPLHDRPPARVRPTLASAKREHARLRILPPAPPPAHAPRRHHRPPRPRDPLLTALGGASGALVLEANALWNEPVGQMLLKCLEKRNPDFRAALGEAHEKLHFDPIRQIDRMAVSPDHVVAFSGFFQGVDFDAMFPNMPRAPYGGNAVIYEPAPGAGPAKDPYVAVWHRELILISPDEAALEHTVDELDGRAPRPPQAISPSDAYGDGYGTLPGRRIAKMVRQADPALADRIAAAVSGVRLHFDASGDVTLDARFTARNGADLTALERTLAGSLAGARVAAAAKGRPHLADLLDDARVVPRGHGFALDLSVPQRWVKAALGHCAIFGPPPGRHPAGQPATTPAASTAAP